uniref:Uncharacterized protein n=1 Tax=Rhizophora mucronata TaxID=61149 RepID=A0A2P2NW26_RHIMU
MLRCGVGDREHVQMQLGGTLPCVGVSAAFYSMHVAHPHLHYILGVFRF